MEAFDCWIVMAFRTVVVGWWYKHCQYCNLNGRYTVGVVWYNHDVHEWTELKATRMKISRNSD